MLMWSFGSLDLSSLWRVGLEVWVVVCVCTDVLVIASACVRLRIQDVMFNWGSWLQFGRFGTGFGTD